MQLPPPIVDYCLLQGWSLFRFSVADKDHVTITPVMPEDQDEFHASLSPEGVLWIPADLRAQIDLGEQSVMIRVENGTIRMFLRKVFQTLGFRPA